MRPLRVAAFVVVIAAQASTGGGAELTADEVVDRMVAANSTWLKARVTSLSYVVRTRPYPGEKMTVHYRAPHHLRAESEPAEAALLLPGGRGFAATDTVEAVEWDGHRARDWALGGLVFRGAAWALVNHRDDCVAWDLQEKRVDGRDAYRIRVSGYLLPDFGIGIDLRTARRLPRQDLWIDAETFRPLREAWAEPRAPSPARRRPGPPPPPRRAWTRRILRYGDYQPFPGGGLAPMQLAEWHDWPEGALGDDSPGPPDTITRYQVLDDRFWCRRDVVGRGGEVLCEVSEVSMAPVPMHVFYDNERLRKLEQLAALCEHMEMLRKARSWDELLATCEQVLALGSTVGGAAETAFDLHFWRGDYQRVIELGARTDVGNPLFLAWAYDAVGDRVKALAIYRELSEEGSPSADWPEVQQGLEKAWAPVMKRLRPQADERPLKPDENWQVAAEPEGLTQRDAIDGDRSTRWISVTAQQPGMWYQIGLGIPTTLSRMVFDFAGDLTLDYHDYPRRYVVEISTDGDDWETVAEGHGLRDGLLEVRMPPQPVRFVRIRQEGHERAYCWSIREIFLYAPK
jgi:hypothetical protein